MCQFSRQIPSHAVGRGPLCPAMYFKQETSAGTGTRPYTQDGVV